MQVTEIETSTIASYLELTIEIEIDPSSFPYQ